MSASATQGGHNKQRERLKLEASHNSWYWYKRCLLSLHCWPIASVKGHVTLRSANYRELTKPHMKVKHHGPVSMLLCQLFGTICQKPKHLHTDDIVVVNLSQIVW